jgi:hypothetical protein
MGHAGESPIRCSGWALLQDFTHAAYLSVRSPDNLVLSFTGLRTGMKRRSTLSRTYDGGYYSSCNQMLTDIRYFMRMIQVVLIRGG